MKAKDLLLTDDEIEENIHKAGGFIAGNYQNATQSSLKTAKTIRELLYDYENMHAESFMKKWGVYTDELGLQLGLLEILDSLIKEIENELS